MYMYAYMYIYIYINLPYLLINWRNYDFFLNYTLRASKNTICLEY